MRYILNKSLDPYFNLALDEYAMKHIDVDEDFFFLWQNAPSVIIGKNQNTAEEINQKFIDQHGIKVARRVSGGGAVYHDLGNLNFTFVISVDDPGKVNYKKYVQPIIDALESMGIKAEASGRNDILVDGLKISGNAQRMANGKLMHHGTIMFDLNIENMVKALNVDPDKITSKGVKSVRSRVTNIKEHLTHGDIHEFWDNLHYYLSNEGQDQEIVLTEDDIAKIQAEADSKFSTWDWIYGASPEFNLKNSKRFSGGRLETLMNVVEGKIASIRFVGDYLGLEDVSEVENQLMGVRFDRSDVDGILSQIDLKKYFGLIDKGEILSLMFD
ncbi:MAG: lipoate--protein ligase [Erysipelothrix sp.]|nr:lipoate--protein ligase [Erysipelothrix sp.]